MKKTQFTETQIVAIINQHEAGIKVSDICREKGISEQTFRNQKAKYGGMIASDIKRMWELEEENSMLKKMFAELSLVHTALTDVMEKKFPGLK